MAAQSAPQIISPIEMLGEAPRIITTVNPGVQAWADNGLISFQLPRTGLGGRMWLNVQLTVTVGGTVTSGTFKNYLPNGFGCCPYSAIKNIQFGPNSNVLMRNHSGWGGYKHNRYRSMIDPLVKGSTEKFSNNALTSLGISSTNRPVPGANVAAQAYTLNLSLPLPIAYNSAGEEALLKLQNESIYSLNLQTANIASSMGPSGGSSDLFDTIVSANNSLTVAVTGKVYLTMEYWRWVDTTKFDYTDQTNSFMSIIEQNFPLTTGPNFVQPPRTDLFTMILAEITGNGSPVSDANIQNVAVNYANNMQTLSMDRYTNLVKSYYDHDGLVPMDGVWDLDYGLRAGNKMRRDIFDGVNNRSIVDFTLAIQVAAAQNMTNGNCNLLMEALVDAA